MKIERQFPPQRRTFPLKKGEPVRLALPHFRIACYFKDEDGSFVGYRLFISEDESFENVRCFGRSSYPEKDGSTEALPLSFPHIFNDGHASVGKDEEDNSVVGESPEECAESAFASFFQRPFAYSPSPEMIEIAQGDDWRERILEATKRCPLVDKAP